MSKAKKVISSGSRVEKVGDMWSRAAVSLCGKFLFEGERSNPESEKRNALLTVKDRVRGNIIGKFNYMIFYLLKIRYYNPQ